MFPICASKRTKIPRERCCVSVTRINSRYRVREEDGGRVGVSYQPRVKSSRTKGTRLFVGVFLDWRGGANKLARSRIRCGGYRPYFISGIYLPNARWYSAFHRIKEPRKRFLLGISVIPLPKIDEPILTGSFLLLVPFLPTNILPL